MLLFHFWTVSTTLAAGHSHLAVTVFGVLLSWHWSCLSCLGNMRQGSREPHKCHVLTEPLWRAGSPCQKEDRAPLVSRMPCCIKSVSHHACKYNNTFQHLCLHIKLHMQQSPTEIHRYLQSCVYLLYPLFLLSSLRLSCPVLCRCVTFLPRFLLPGSLSCAWAYWAEGFKQERQHLSVRLACPQLHMPLHAHVTTCLEVPVGVH